MLLIYAAVCIVSFLPLHLRSTSLADMQQQSAEPRSNGIKGHALTLSSFGSWKGDQKEH